jgi:hypothetical protein
MMPFGCGTGHAVDSIGLVAAYDGAVAVNLHMVGIFAHVS